MILPLTFIKVWLILSQKNKNGLWIKIVEEPEYKFFDNTDNLSIGSFYYHSKWNQEEALCYVVSTFPNEIEPLGYVVFTLPN